MSTKIRTIKVGELEDYIHSNEFIDLPFFPISKIRAISHFRNPRADVEEPALFLYFDNNKFVGYLGGMPDQLFDKKNTVKVFWLSCMWILPEYRRKGVAFELMNYAFDAYNGKTLITNYIPESKAVFDKTGNYEILQELKGIRGFVRSDLATIIQRKYRTARRFSWLLKGVDVFLNLFLEYGLIKVNKRLKTSCTYTGVNSIDEELAVFIQNKMNNSSFRRGQAEFDWMINYPWVVNEGIPESERKRYFFSQQGEDYKQWFLKVEYEREIVGFIVITRFNGELKTPYLLYHEEFTEDIAVFISKLIIETDINTFVCHNPNIIKYIQKRKFLLYKKESVKGFLISKSLKEKLGSQKFELFEGDGDTVFT